MTVTGSAISALNGYKEIENAFKSAMIALKSLTESLTLSWRHVLYAGMLRVRITMLLLFAVTLLLLNIYIKYLYTVELKFQRWNTNKIYRFW